MNTLTEQLKQAINKQLEAEKQLLDAKRSVISLYKNVARYAHLGTHFPHLLFGIPDFSELETVMGRYIEASLKGYSAESEIAYLIQVAEHSDKMKAVVATLTPEQRQAFFPDEEVEEQEEPVKEEIPVFCAADFTRRPFPEVVRNWVKEIDKPHTVDIIDVGPEVVLWRCVITKLPPNAEIPN